MITQLLKLSLLPCFVRLYGNVTEATSATGLIPSSVPIYVFTIQNYNQITLLQSSCNDDTMIWRKDAEAAVDWKRCY